MEDPNKKYKPMENILQFINSKTIALQNKEKKRNNKILDQVINTLIPLLKQMDQLFGGMFERFFYGGSYYDKLKVGNPNEYDLDLVLNLPVLIEPSVECSDQPGFVKVEIKEYVKMVVRPEVERKKFEKINTIMDENNYLSTTRVLIWMESIITLALNEMPKEGSDTYVDIVDQNKPDEHIRIYIKISKGAPAFTMNLTGTDIDGSAIQLDVDLVPCFQFVDKNNWPGKRGGYRSNTSKLRNKFLIVPKQPKGELILKSPDLEKYWRLSFQEQERDLIGRDLKTLKPALRLLKKLREKYKHKIASYFIKTVFLWIVEEEPETFWSQSLSVVFMTMLRKYAERLREKNIPYYWNKQFNLIDYLKDSTKNDVANTLQNIIKDVEQNLTEPAIDPFIIGKYLLSPEHFEKLKQDVPLGKKLERNISIVTANAALNCTTLDTPDSRSDCIPPMVTVLNFDPITVDTYKQYSDLVEEKQKLFLENIITQINNRYNDTSNNSNNLTYLKRIDQKMDKLLEKITEINDYQSQTDSTLTCLKEQMRILQVENTVR